MSSGQTIFEEECLRCARRSDAYQEAFHASENALQLFSRNARIIDINPAMAEICQFPVQQVINQPFEALFPRTSDYQTLLAPETMTPFRPLFSFTTLMQTKDKGCLPVNICVSPLPGTQEETPVFQAQVTPLPDQEPPEAPAPQRPGANSQDGPRMGIARSGALPGGRYMETDPAMTEILGYTDRELSAMNILALIDDPVSKKEVVTALDRDRTVRVPELSLRHKRGNTVQVTYIARQVIQTGTGTPVVDEVILETVPASQIEAACQTADRLRSIGALAGGIAHNFNNILTGIYGNITLARMELTDQSTPLHHLEKAENSMEEAVKLTRQLLTFAKGGDPVKETFHPGPLLEELVAFNLSGSRVKPILRLHEGLWQVHGDRDQLTQVIANIVINARQAMPEGGTLEVDVENTTLLKDNLLTIAKGAYIKICLKDSGTGIAQHDLDRIFDPYFTTRPDGNGMGLAICYSIVTKHKGHISATSQLGSGTAVTLYLPAVPDTLFKEETMNSETIETPRASILVMDDEEHIRTITQKMLEKFGHAVTMTEDGEQAVEAYAKAMEAGTPYHVVIMDLTIPGGMGGQEASKIILDMDPEAKIVVSSGYSNDRIMSDYKAYGLKGIIPKPFRLTELKATIEDLISE